MSCVPFSPIIRDSSRAACAPKPSRPGRRYSRAHRRLRGVRARSCRDRHGGTGAVHRGHALAVQRRTARRGSTERLLRVAALARELQSGAYPDCEWVRRAPDLVLGFFASEPQYARENVPRVVAVFREFLMKNFDVAVNPLGNGVGYLITSKLPGIFAAAGGEAIAEIDRFFLDRKTGSADPAAVRYVRGLCTQLADGVKTRRSKTSGAGKRTPHSSISRVPCGSLQPKSSGITSSIEFKGKNCGVAVKRYREHLSRFPRSEWAWVAGLRIGQCEQFLGNWVEARQAYESVTSTRRELPPAVVLGHTFAGRASEALHDFERARNAYERAERAWEPRFADPHFGMSSSTRGWTTSRATGAIRAAKRTYRKNGCAGA